MPVPPCPLAERRKHEKKRIGASAGTAFLLRSYGGIGKEKEKGGRKKTMRRSCPQREKKGKKAER